MILLILWIRFTDTTGNSFALMIQERRIILDFPVMKSKADTTCVFYDNGCTIYSIRPKACRLFPFRVEEETTPQGDIILNISCNKSCPGMGTGKIADKKSLEKLVSDQFQERSESVAAEVRVLAAGRQDFEGCQGLSQPSRPKIPAQINQIKEQSLRHWA